MKSLVALVTSLLLPLATGQICCPPFLDYQAYITSYTGYTNTNAFRVDPDAYVGRARRTLLFSRRLELTEYIDYPVPGFENIRSTISDARRNPGIVYTINKDGSCNAQEVIGLTITPPCVPGDWSYKETLQVGTAVWDRYGNDGNKNYVFVERANCLPVMELTTSKNLPSTGIYQFMTEIYANVTAFSGGFNVPFNCLQQLPGQTQAAFAPTSPFGAFPTRQPSQDRSTPFVGGRPNDITTFPPRGGPGPAQPTQRVFGGQTTAPAPAPNRGGGTTRAANNIPNVNNNNNFATPRNFN